MAQQPAHTAIFYYLTAAFANGVSAYDAASTGDPVTAGRNATSALGDLLLAGDSAQDGIALPLKKLASTRGRARPRKRRSVAHSILPIWGAGRRLPVGLRAVRPGCVVRS